MAHVWVGVGQCGSSLTARLFELAGAQEATRTCPTLFNARGSANAVLVDSEPKVRPGERLAV